MMQKKHNSRGRPILDEKQKVDRDILKQKFMENSIEAFETILSIMRLSMDSSVRLKASTYILNKLIPDGFSLDEEMKKNIEVQIHVVDSENKINRTRWTGYMESRKGIPLNNAKDMEEWDIEEWGNEVYTGWYMSTKSNLYIKSTKTYWLWRKYMIV